VECNFLYCPIGLSGFKPRHKARSDIADFLSQSCTS
jgi:hypothetical protein